MNQAELERYRQRLLAWGKRLKGEVSTLEGEALRKAGGEASGNLSNTPVHMGDLSADNFEQEVTLGLLENQEQQLEEIAAALRRVEDGTFGRCEDCGQPIGKERLDALPYARFCVQCARKEQAGT